MKRRDDPPIGLQGTPMAACHNGGGSVMATRRVVIALTFAAVIAGTAGCDTSSTPNQTTSNTAPVTTSSFASAGATASSGATTSSGQPSPAAGAQSACADLGGTVDPDQTCHIHTVTSSYTLDFSFPVDYADQHALSEFLTQQRDQFVDFAHKDPPTGRPKPYELNATGTAYRSGPPASGTQSLVFAIEDDTGDANQAEPASSYTSFNYDLSKGAPITFDTLFKPGTKPADVQRASQNGGTAAVLPPFDGFGANGYQNFAITDDAVIFFFDHDILHEDGPSQVSVPRTELASLLA
jgi:hypothetical protein